MVNVAKIRKIADDKGIKLSYITEKLGLKSRGYFNNVEAGKCTISDDRLAIIADILGTTTAYLRDETDDPSPIKKAPLSPEGEDERAQLKAELFSLIDEMDDDTLSRFAAVEKIITASDEDYEKIMAMIEIMLG